MRKFFLRSIFSWVIFICFSNAYAENAASDLIAILNKVRTMKANFNQTLYDNHGNVKQKTNGSMALQRPGKFRWDVTKPQPQLIVADDKKIWIYDPDLEQLTIRSMQQTKDETPALLLSHDNANVEDHFIVKSLQKNSPGWIWFSLKSKKSDSMFQTIEMGFNQNQIHEMRLRDNLGHTTVVEFQDIQTNLNLPSSLFSVNPSSKADVIDETRKN